MQLSDWIAIAVAGLSLIVSAVTLYLTQLSGFRGWVAPSARVVLMQVEGLPALVMRCVFGNDGSTAGSVEDIVINFREQDTGTAVPFIPILIRDTFDIWGPMRKEDFDPFFAVPIGANGRTEHFVLFRPTYRDFRPSGGAFELTIKYRLSSKPRWKNVKRKLIFEIGDAEVKTWRDPDGGSQLIEPKNIGSARVRDGFI